MINYNTIDLFPVEQLRKVIGSDVYYSEMTEFDHSFLCGIFNKKRPTKILEVGVAAGVTSSLILELGDYLETDFELFSLDISKQWYRNSEYETGFVAEKRKAGHKHRNNHVRLFGTIAERIDNACKDGKKIDCLILDTMHTLPGELLDFIISFPYLSDDAVVILHDVNLMHMLTMDPKAISTRLLFDSVCGEKYYNEDVNSFNNLSNIAAFIINKHTAESMDYLFHYLLYPWSYIMEDTDFEQYVDKINQLYGAEKRNYILSLFDIQKRSYYSKVVAGHFGTKIEDLIQCWKELDNVYIYGYGYWGKRYIEFSKLYNLNINGIILSDNQFANNISSKDDNIPIISLSQFEEKKKRGKIILAVGAQYYRDCYEGLKDHNLESMVIGKNNY